MRSVLAALASPHVVAGVLTDGAFFHAERKLTHALHRQGMRTEVVQHAREVSAGVSCGGCVPNASALWHPGCD